MARMNFTENYTRDSVLSFLIKSGFEITEGTKNTDRLLYSVHIDYIRRCCSYLSRTWNNLRYGIGISDTIYRYQC